MNDERRREIALTLLGEARRSELAPDQLIGVVAAGLGARREQVAVLFWEMVEARYLNRHGRPLAVPAEAVS